MENKSDDIDVSIARRVLLKLVSNKYFRWAGVRLYTLSGILSAKLSLDPVVELSLARVGINATFELHLFKRDMTALVEVFLNRVYDAPCTLQPGDTVVDCGASIGEFTVLAASRVGSEGLVLAFEPNPESFLLCKRNVVKNNLGNVMLFNKALGDKEANAYLEIDKTNLGHSRILWEGSKNSVSNVSVSTLAQVVPLIGNRTIKLLKMDVEGSAIRIICGGQDLLKKRMIQNIAAEMHPGEEGLRKLLEGHDFRCVQRGSYLYATLPN